MSLRAFAQMVIIVCALCTVGCVKNQLLRLETRDFSAKAVEATTAGQAFYIDSIQKDQQLYELLYTLDARCVPPSLRSTIPDSPPPRRMSSNVSEFCLQLHNDLSYSTSFQREFGMLDFVSSYVSALAETAADPKLVASGAFSKAATDFNTVSAALGDKDGISADKVKAVSDLLNAAEAIAKDAQSAKEIRALFKEKGSAAQSQLEDLANAMVKAQDDADADAKATRITRGLAVAAGVSDAELDPWTRAQLVESIHRDELDQWRHDREVRECKASKAVIEKGLERFCGAKAAGLIYATAQAHKELGQLIADNPSPRQRRRRAALAYRQFLDLVGVFVGLRGAF